VLPAMAGMTGTMRVNVEELRRQATDGFTLATEVADWLSRRGVPFSEAHEITGALVRYCEDRGIGLEDLSEADLAAVDARLDPSVKSCLTLDAAVTARHGYGGTAPDRVAEQLSRLRAIVDGQREWAMRYKGPRA
jgi:argininosuccinate lyase